MRWTKEKVVSCDGGGGPLGHPKIFINTDKPEIATCGYCGLPFVCVSPIELCGCPVGAVTHLECQQAQEQHRAYLESLPATSYPLKPLGDAAEVNEQQRITDGALEQR